MTYSDYLSHIEQQRQSRAANLKGGARHSAADPWHLDQAVARAIAAGASIQGSGGVAPERDNMMPSDFRAIGAPANNWIPPQAALRPYYLGTGRGGGRVEVASEPSADPDVLSQDLTTAARAAVTSTASWAGCSRANGTGPAWTRRPASRRSRR